MLYSFHDLQRSWAASVAAIAGSTAELLRGQDLLPARFVRAGASLLHRITRPYPRPVFGLTEIAAHGHQVAVAQEVLAVHPFCRLVRFGRHADDAATNTALAADPRVLVCAPLSGHHPTLLRDTIATLLQDHDVYLTDWLDAREVPVADGVFHLADYVTQIQRFLRLLGPDLHVVSVCQPTVPVLAAIALMATAGEPTPRTLTLMGGPIDARESPTVVNKFATDHPIEFFEAQMIHRVPPGHPGAGRAVYPGFLQLAAFVMMNPTRHAEAYRSYWFDQLRGDAEAIAIHERFYDEYNAVLDMDAAYYLETVKTVFQDHALARGTWDVHGQRVRPAAITTTALFTIEGALDDISGLGQTAAAHGLCTGITVHRQLVVESCGHYGLFSGQRWRTAIAPEIAAFVRAHP